MRLGVRVTALMLAMLTLGGCYQSDRDMALKEVRLACGPGNGPAPQLTKDSMAVDFEAAAAAVDDQVERAARAARLDARWDRLSNAWTNVQAAYRAKAATLVSDTPAANEALARLDFAGSSQIVQQECRKALAD